VSEVNDQQVIQSAQIDVYGLSSPLLSVNNESPALYERHNVFKPCLQLLFK